MTRAKQRLVLTGLWSDHQQRSGRGQSIEYLQPRIESTQGLAEWLAGSARGETSDFVDRVGARWSFPVLEAGEEAAVSDAVSRGIELPSESEIAEASRRLIALRENARERMLRPMSATASARDHDPRGDREDGDRKRPHGPASVESGADARAIGSAVHRALENFDFSADVEVEIQSQRDAVARELSQTRTSDHAEETITAGTQLWGRIAKGGLFARLRELSDRIIARELPVLSPPQIGAGGPVGYLTGMVDLVYRDPGNDQLVVVDYKTDALLDSEAIQRRADAYAEQGTVYRRALRDALGLSYIPRFELWFLQADEIVRFETQPSPPAC